MKNSYQQQLPESRVNITLEVDDNGQRQQHELPLKMLVLGDFSLRRTQQCLSVDPHCIDKTMKKLSPQLQAELEDMVLDLSFSSLKDFEPDSIIQNVPALHKLNAIKNLLIEFKSHLIDHTELASKLQELNSNNTLQKVHASIKGK